MLIVVTRACPMLNPNDSSTFGLDLLPSLFSPISIPICGSSPISSIGMIKQCYLSNITGKRQRRRISNMSSCGTRFGTGTTEIHTTSIGLFTSLRFLLFLFLADIVLSLLWLQPWRKLTLLPLACTPEYGILNVT